MFQRTAQWMFPNPHYHERVPDGDRWAMRHLPFYGRWFRFLTFYPGAGPDARPLARRPELRRQRRPRGQRDERRDPGAVRQLDHRADRRRPDLLDRVMPDYPATAKRMLQDNGSWLACLRKDNVELVRTGIERIVDRRHRHRRRRAPSGGRDLLRHRLPPQRLPLADAHRRARRPRRCASNGASSRRPTSASRSRTSRTSSACTGRARTSRTAEA